MLIVVVRFLTVTSSPPFPGPIGYNCGEVRSYGVGYVDDRDQAESCLWQHYQHCQSASLQWGGVFVDTGTSSMFAVQAHNGGCAVTYYTQDSSTIMIRNVSHPVDVYNCGGLRQQNGGLVAVGCGAAGDITLPGRPPQQMGKVCAEFGSDDLASDQLTGDDCFWQAYMTCASAASLVYLQPVSANATATPSGGFNPYTLLSHTLVAQPTGGACAVTDAAQPTTGVPDSTPAPYIVYRCAGLERLPSGGLLAKACGAEGNVTIPPL